MSVVYAQTKGRSSARAATSPIEIMQIATLELTRNCTNVFEITPNMPLYSSLTFAEASHHALQMLYMRLNRNMN